MCRFFSTVRTERSPPRKKPIHPYNKVNNLKNIIIMSDICDRSILHDFGYDCENPNAAGLEKEALLINFDDIDRVASVVTNTPATGQQGAKTVLTKLVLKAGKKANTIVQVKDSFSGTAVAQADGTYTTGFNHTFAFVSFDRSPAAKQAIANMVNTRTVAVVVNKTAPDDSKYEVFGWYSGLGATATVTQDYVAAEGVGAIPITLVSGLEPALPLSFYDTDLETTAAAFDTLKTIAVPAN